MERSEHEKRSPNGLIIARDYRSPGGATPRRSDTLSNKPTPIIHTLPPRGGDDKSTPLHP